MDDLAFAYHRKLDLKFEEADRLAALPHAARELYRRLCVLRLRLARDGRVPAYQVLGNKALMALCEQIPNDEESLVRIRGFGHVRMRAYGAEFLAVINDAMHPRVSLAGLASIGRSEIQCDT